MNTLQEEYEQIKTNIVEQNIRKYRLLVRALDSFIGVEIFDKLLVDEFINNGYTQKAEWGIFTENYFMKKHKISTLDEMSNITQYFIDLKAVFAVGKASEWHPQGIVSFLRDEKKMVKGSFYYCTWYRPFGYWIIKEDYTDNNH